MCRWKIWVRKLSKLILTPMDISGRKRLTAALVKDGRICQLNLCRFEHKSILGNIYVGKVKNITENIRAAFIEIADGIMCYYSMDEKAVPLYMNKKKSGKLKPGDELLVQVCREPIRGKLPCVTCDLNFSGRYLVVTAVWAKLGFSGKLSAEEKRRLKEILQPILPEDAGVIVRTNSRNASEEDLQSELERLLECLQQVKEKAATRTCFSLIHENLPEYLQVLQNVYEQDLEEIVTDNKELYGQISHYLEYYGMTDNRLRFYEDKLLPLSRLYSLETVLKEALSEKVWLKSGAFLVIQQTEAFVSIDVNTGKYTGKKDYQETFRKINLEAAKEIARQLRLRNLSGMILIDFINLKEQKDKEELLYTLQRYLNEDPVKGNVVDITKLNIVEVTRKKIRKSLAEELREEYQESVR